jgi:hypothetical protein
LFAAFSTSRRRGAPSTGTGSSATIRSSSMPPSRLSSSAYFWRPGAKSSMSSGSAHASVAATARVAADGSSDAAAASAAAPRAGCGCTSTWPMCDTSNRPARSRTCACSAFRPAGYWIGMS